MAGFGEDEDGVPVQQVLLRQVEGLIVVGQRFLALVLHAESRQHARPKQELTEKRMDIEGIGPGYEMHLAVVPGKQDAHDIVKRVLVVHGHQNGGSLRGNMVGILYITLPIKDSVTGKAEIDFGKPISQREFFHLSSQSEFPFDSQHKDAPVAAHLLNPEFLQFFRFKTGFPGLIRQVAALQI